MLIRQQEINELQTAVEALQAEVQLLQETSE